MCLNMPFLGCPNVQSKSKLLTKEEVCLDAIGLGGFFYSMDNVFP